jgi:hypothetical protein
LDDSSADLEIKNLRVNSPSLNLRLKTQFFKERDFSAFRAKKMLGDLSESGFHPPSFWKKPSALQPGKFITQIISIVSLILSDWLKNG